jgi:predicted peroxiredoxin
MNLTQRLATSILVGTLLTTTGAIAESKVSKSTENKALFIVTSDSLQTQGMAMVLGNAMQAKGVSVDVLLCDQAGDLAISSTVSQALKPINVTPEKLISKLQLKGANISVCALYLPNSEYSAQDLRDGIKVATPPEMANMMTSENVRVYSF